MITFCLWILANMIISSTLMQRTQSREKPASDAAESDLDTDGDSLRVD